jgi:hypothetical protein
VSAPEPQDLARLRAALAAGRGPEPAEADAERIFAALHGEMDAKDRQAVVDEMLKSADGVDVWQLAKELAPPGVQRSAMPPSASVWTWLPLAATLAITIGAGWLVFKPSGPESAPAYRSADGPTIASALPAGARLARGNPVLRWTPVEGARYRVRVLSAALEPLDEAADLTSAEYRVRAGVLDLLPSGTTLLWQVEARAPGRATVVSPTFTVLVE